MANRLDDLRSPIEGEDKEEHDTIQGVIGTLRGSDGAAARLLCRSPAAGAIGIEELEGAYNGDDPPDGVGCSAAMKTGGLVRFN